MPVSMTRTRSSHRTSMQVVFPPYLMVCGPGVGTLPLTPQNLTMKHSLCVVIYVLLGRGCAVKTIFIDRLWQYISTS